MEEQSYWCQVPTELIEEGDHLKALLYGLVTSFAKKSGQCWASNKTLATKLGRKDDSIISKKLQELQKDGFVSIEVDKMAGNKRVISIALRKKPQSSTEISDTSNIYSNKESKGKKISKKPSSVESKEFIEFYNLYPKKKDRQAALKSWNKINPSHTLVETIMIAVSAQTQSEDWQKDNGRYIPLPSTWLNNARWEDEVDVPEEEKIYIDEEGRKYTIYDDGYNPPTKMMVTE